MKLSTRGRPAYQIPGLRQLRQAAGLTTEEAGRRANLSADIIGLLELGDRSLTERTLKGLAAAYGISEGQVYRAYRKTQRSVRGRRRTRKLKQAMVALRGSARWLCRGLVGLVWPGLVTRSPKVKSTGGTPGLAPGLVRAWA